MTESTNNAKVSQKRVGLTVFVTEEMRDKLLCIANAEDLSMSDMENIAKALQDLAKAVESNDTVERVKVTITLKKPKASKANTKAE